MNERVRSMKKVERISEATIRQKLAHAEGELEDAKQQEADRGAAYADASAAEVLHGQVGRAECVRQAHLEARQVVADAEARVQGLREHVARFLANEKAEQNAFIAAEKVRVVGELTANVREIRALLERLVATHKAFNGHLRALHDLDARHALPDFWMDQFVGSIRNFLGARGSDLFPMPESIGFELRQGADLVTKHKAAVRTYLGDSLNDDTQAAA